MEMARPQCDTPLVYVSKFPHFFLINNNNIGIQKMW
jgi:hypothetical protein